MKRKLSYNKVIINNTHQLNELTKKNNSNPIDELEVSIPGIPIDLEKIPLSVSVLRFNYNFENLPHEIPPNIKSVYFYEFSEPIEELPNTIEHIQIHKGFNHPVDKLGNHLKSIDFGWNFNQPVDDLPSSLEKVVFYSSFTHPINNLPSNIKFIHIYNPNYDFSSIKILPKSLILLQLGLNNDFDFTFDFNFCLEDKKYIYPQMEKSYDERKRVFLKNIYFYKN
jgi:hypothetical protein